MKREAFAAFAWIMAIMPAVASDPAGTVVHYQMIGTIGPYQVGANLTVGDHDAITAAHYFYASKPVDIPLTGKIVDETIQLQEPGGGVFDLQFESGDKAAARPLTFSTSTALTGTWTGNGHHFPVRLNFDAVGGQQGADRYKDVTDVAAPVFEAMVQRFLHGAIAGDRAKTTSAVSFPLRLNGANGSAVHDRAQLEARWPQVFTPCMIATLKAAIPHEMFVRNGEAMVANGAVWFGRRGATSLNVPTCSTN